MRLSFNIDSDNEAMATGTDAATALRRLADQVEVGGIATGPVRDANGNTVGRYSFEIDVTDSQAALADDHPYKINYR